jgi:glycosyltransferase involved in cell wall biosynthesis
VTRESGSCQSRIVRIAIVGANQAVVGGAETYLTWLLRALLTRDHEVAFAFERAAENPEEAVDRGLEPLTRWNLEAVPRAEFLTQLASFRPDVVFLQGAADERLDITLTQRFRVVLFAHAFYATCATGWRMHHLPSLRVCTRRFGAACLPINYLRGCGARNPLQLLNVYSNQRARSKVLQGLAGLVVASNYMRQVYIQHGVNERDIRVLPPPVNLDPDPAPPSARESPSRMLFLGRFTSGKGGVRAIQAAARCQRSMGNRPLQLTMAGDGPELARCKRLAIKLGVPTDFPGWVSPDQRLELLQKADVLIVPSLWPEPYGMVGVEAASVGVPAVAYRAGGIVDWLRPGESGELAEGFGSRTLAAALERALRDPQHHYQLRLGARRMAHEFNGQRHVSQLETFFRDISSCRS